MANALLDGITRIFLTSEGPIDLNGVELEVAVGTHVVIYSGVLGRRGGMVINGEGRSRIFNIKGTLELESITIRNGRAQYGGGIFVHSSATAKLSHVAIEACKAIAGGSTYGNAYGGGVYVNVGGSIKTFASTISGCSATNSHTIQYARGGGIYALGAVAMHGTAIKACGVHARRGDGEGGQGGGLFFDGDALLLADATLVRDNTASGAGSALFLGGGVAAYRLPAPEGHFVFGSECRVYRQACPRDIKGNIEDSSCSDVEEQCAEELDESASVNGTLCQPLLKSQPCDWKTQPELIGTTVQPLPHGPIDSDFPPACAAGLLGSNQTELQASAGCAGRCPAGYHCPDSGTVIPTVCPAGSACPAGSSVAIACPDGTWASDQGLESIIECLQCPMGSYCPTGAVRPKECNPGTYSSAPSAGQCAMCPRGTYQSHANQTECTVCEAGFICAEGATTPVPCKAGTFLNATGRWSEAQCQPVPVDFWAPLGSALPEACPATGFFCPGAANDAVNKVPGSKPIIIPVGERTERVEVSSVQKQMTLDLSIDEYDETAVKWELSRLYNVPVELISLEAAAGSLQITMTIFTKPNPSSTVNGTSQELDFDALVTAVESVNDGSLSKSFAKALGVSNVSLSTSPAVRSSTLVVVRAMCPKGHWCTAGETVPCERGFYNPHENNDTAKACLQCMRNGVTLVKGAFDFSQCTCADGYVEVVRDGDRRCVCPKGSSENAAQVCEPCQQGFFKDEDSEAGCKPCLGSTTIGVGATNASDCVCLANSYNAYDNGGTQRDCQRCDEMAGQAVLGTECLRPGVELKRLPLRLGFWRSYERSKFIWQCPTPDACIPSNTSTEEGTLFGSRNLSAPGCRYGHWGAFCELCIDSYYKADGLCKECGQRRPSQLALLTIPPVAVLVVLFFFFCHVCVASAADARMHVVKEKVKTKIKQRATERATEALGSHADASADNAARATVVMRSKTLRRVKNILGRDQHGKVPWVQTDLKVLISLVQVLSSLSLTFSISFPPIYSSVMRWLGMVQFDFLETMPLACLGMRFSFHTSLLARTLFPLMALLVAITIRALGTYNLRLHAAGDRLLTAVFTLIFLIYPSTSHKIFSSFNCIPFDDPNQSRALRMDLSVDCDGALHRGMQIYAYVMMLVYPIGVPLTYAYILYGRFGSRMRMMQTIATRRSNIRMEALQKLLQNRRQRYEDAAKSGTQTAMPAVKFPKDNEIPRETSNEIKKLEQQQERIYHSLPPFVKKLVGGYRMEAFWFEIFECLRKLALVCIPVFFDPPGSASQLIFGLVLCFCTFGFYTATAPFDDKGSNIVAQLCQAQIFFALLSSVSLKFSGTLTSTALHNLDAILTVLTFMPLVALLAMRAQSFANSGKGLPRLPRETAAMDNAPASTEARDRVECRCVRV